MALFPKILGATFNDLPPAVRRIHDGSKKTTAQGQAMAERARGIWPWLICTVAGLPNTGQDIPVTVTFSADSHGGEQWARQFAARRYASTMGTGRLDGEIVEYFGAFTLFYRLTAHRTGLRWTITAWSFLGISLPHWSIPIADVMESEHGGHFTFDITVAFPLVGRVIAYRGWLAVTAP